MTVPPGHQAGPLGEPAAAAACVRHPDRPTAVRCARCDRPACPDCLREAAVGFQCVDCVSEGARTSRRWRSTTVAGATEGASPVVMPILILVNLAVFVVTVIQAGSLQYNSDSPLFQQWQLNPAAAADGAWWTFLTSGFLHFGPIHVMMNMLALWVIGRDLERALGPARFLAVYLVSLFGGSVAEYLFGQPDFAFAGASGAVFGLMGGLLVVCHRSKLGFGPVLGMIVINLALSVAIPHISLLGHVGGLVVGAGLTAAIVYAPTARRSLWQAGAVAAVFVVLLGMAFVGGP